MTRLPVSKLLGIALIAGGAVVGIVVMMLFSSYAAGGQLSTTGAALLTLTAFILIVLPQFTLGIYLIRRDIWRDMGETAVSPPPPNPPAE